MMKHFALAHKEFVAGVAAQFPCGGRSASGVLYQPTSSAGLAALRKKRSPVHRHALPADRLLQEHGHRDQIALRSATSR